MVQQCIMVCREMRGWGASSLVFGGHPPLSPLPRARGRGRAAGNTWSSRNPRPPPPPLSTLWACHTHQHLPSISKTFSRYAFESTRRIRVKHTQRVLRQLLYVTKFSQSLATFHTTSHLSSISAHLASLTTAHLLLSLPPER